MIFFQKLNGRIVNRGDLPIATVTWLPVIWEKELFRWVCNDYAPKALLVFPDVVLPFTWNHRGMLWKSLG